MGWPSAPPSVHVWIGRVVMDLAIEFHRRKMFLQAVGVVEVGCEVLEVWCGGGGGEEERKARAEEVRTCMYIYNTRAHTQHTCTHTHTHIIA